MEYGKNLSHAYIVAAPAAEGEAKAMELAAAILCSSPGNRPCGICRNCAKMKKGIHPDLMTVSRLEDDKGKLRREIYVEQIRDMAATAYILPNEAEKKVYLIREAGTMNTNAQNALLKVLEEPPPFVAFILAAESAGQLLETVRSRCVAIGVNAEPDAPTAEARERAEKYLAAAARGSETALLQQCNALGELGAAELKEFTAAAKWLLADMLCGRLPDLGLSRKKMMELTALMDRCAQYLRVNVSTKHLCGLLSVRTI